MDLRALIGGRRRGNAMRIALIGQQAFGKAALEAFLARGDTVAGVFVAPEEPGARPDPLRVAATERGIALFQFPRLGSPAALDALTRLEAELGIMAYVTQFAPQSFCRLPRHGTIQFHPSLLPQHRGPSSINWAVIQGRRKTGLSIFRPVDGLDEGPVLLQKEIEIGADDTVGSLYFDKIFPAGIAALLEAADQVHAGTAVEQVQDESRATYEGWVREAESHINWANHVDRIHDLIRGCDPAPGAWTRHHGCKLHLFDARKHPAHTFAAVKGLSPGQVTEVSERGITIYAQGGFIQAQRCRLGEGKKLAAAETGIAVGTLLGE
jgi:methionyl-tRNA formyltransferase